MSDTIIRVENLSKKYIIGHQQEESYTALRDVIANKVKSIGKLIQNPQAKITSSQEEFWALKDLSFEINRGDRVGIIGRNGAGKSTLLKILSRITEPTKGRINIKGRIASLLEVGTGFHPELTGRENIYLNGAILGMSKLEIQRKFDEIVEFSEIEKFLDTPVKRYSSGMYVRLAFAVAAHLEPEILIVDEVLAVGDAQFQKKCLGKMEDVAQAGRTVLFVSHNMGTITQLCTKAIYLNQGQVQSIGEVNSVIFQYLASGTNCALFQNNKPNKAKYPVYISEISILNHEQEVTSEIDVRYPFYIRLIYEVNTPVRNAELSVGIKTNDGIPVFTTHQSDHNPDTLKFRNVGTYTVLIKVPEMFLMPGAYLISAGAHEPMAQMYDSHENVLTLNVNETGTSLAKYQHHRKMGVIIANLPWLEKNLQVTDTNVIY